MNDRPRQCRSCQHYDCHYDPDTGSGTAGCNAVPTEQEGASEQIGVVLERILFALSEMNNCPMHEANACRDIRHLRPPTTAP